MKHIFKLATLAVLSAAAVGGAWAAQSGENDALEITGARIGLIQAVTAAEQHVGGRAAKAEFEHHKGQPVFDIEVVKDRKVMDVKVDAASGKVIAAVEDKADRDDEDDGKD